MVKLGYTILYVSDVTKSIQFYERAFGLERKFITPQNDYAELLTGETTLSFASKELAVSNLPDGFTEANLQMKPFAVEIGFVTEQIEEVLETAISAGATVVSPLTTKPWGQQVVYLRDTDGFLIELCTAVQH
ncbi:VOC family protein [Sphingobacterium spiritivorum]|uniref:VOC family protein n=1 Tax=Sphingobacterium spiritivorum TaxID=258 RepID=UPI003DA55426